METRIIQTLSLSLNAKKENWALTNRDKNQVQYYSSVLKSKCKILTNGSDFITLKSINGIEKEIDLIPFYSDLLTDNSLENHIIEEEPYKRFSLNKIKSGEASAYFLKCGHIGVDTDKSLYPFISNLVDLLFDSKSNFENLRFNHYKIAKDLGTVIETYGNAGGGTWNGEYKKLLIKDHKGNYQTIGIGIFGTAKFQNDPRFGNTKGNTTLVVSIDDFEKSHNSLQLNIDKNYKTENKKHFLTHNGKLTNGNKGSIKYEAVLTYIREKAPHLIPDGKSIHLGSFPEKELFIHTKDYAKEFIKNLIEYAILRDEIRRMYS